MSISNDMLKQLQPFMRRSKVYKAIFDTYGQQLEDRNEMITDLNAQLSVDLATWALQIYEQEYGLISDPNKPLSERRSVIKSRMRGIGTVTANMLKSVAESFINGEVEIIEFSKNKIPPFTDPEWNLHTNITVDGPYAATLTADGADQESFIVLPVQKNMTYTLSFGASGNTSMGMGITSDIVLSVTDEDETETLVPYEGGPMTFNSEEHESIRVSFKNAAGFTGPATIRNLQLERGDKATEFSPQKPYTVGIKFVSQLGIPPNFDDIETAIQEILPAHLAVEYLFTYLTFGDLETKGVTFGDIESAGIKFKDLQTWI